MLTPKEINPTPVIERITSNNASIVGFHLYQKFSEIDEGQVFDLLPSIITKEDHAILRSWMEYFKKNNIPFCITEEQNTSATHGETRKRLWKRRYA